MYALKKPGPQWAYWEDFISDRECENIVNEGLTLPQVTGTIGSSTQEKFDEKLDYRNSTVSWITTENTKFNWLFSRIGDIVQELNTRFFGYDILYSENLQFSTYDSKNHGRYDKHVDMFYDTSIHRKLSVSIQLSDSNDYQGGKLMLYPQRDAIEVNFKKNTLIVFPSFVLHEVTPVTQGTRHSLVTWINGPRFK